MVGGRPLGNSSSTGDTGFSCSQDSGICKFLDPYLGRSLHLAAVLWTVNIYSHRCLLVDKWHEASVLAVPTKLLEKACKKKQNCSCFFSPLPSMVLLAKWCLRKGDTPLVMCPGNKTHCFCALLLQFLLFFGDFLCIHKEQSNKVLWTMCFSVSYFVRDLVLFILQCKHKHLGWFQLMISLLLKISKLKMTWKREKNMVIFYLDLLLDFFWQLTQLPVLYCSSYFREYFCSWDTRGWSFKGCLV